MRILLFGPTGQVGRALSRSIGTHDVVRADRSIADLADPRAVRAIIEQTTPSLVINAAAYTAVDRAESDVEAAHVANADSVAAIAAATADCGAALVHFSTDYVFNGTKRTPYSEADSPAPLNVYGKTKLAGDEAIAAAGVPHLIFRTSWVYAPSGKNFLAAILRRARETGRVRVVNDQVGAPTSSIAIAQAVVRVIDSTLR